MIRSKTKAYFIWVLLILFSACNTMPAKKQTELNSYEDYDQRVNGLRMAVERGDMSVTEAEELRQKAFQDYLAAVRDRQVELEYRNY